MSLESADQRIFDAYAGSYRRAYYFTSACAPLRGWAEKIESAARSHPMIKNVPTRALISQCVNQVMPVSLQLLMRLVFALRMLRDKPQKGPLGKEVSRFLQRHYPEAEVFPDNCIIAALHAVNVGSLASLIRLSEKSRNELSKHILADSSIPYSARPYLLTRLVEGYECKHGNNGVYRLTTQTVNLLWDRLVREFGAEKMPLPEELFPIENGIGYRKGQVSMALPVSFGNLIPAGTSSLKSGGTVSR